MRPGNTIPALQHVIGTDHFKKLSQELRVASPSTEPFRLVGGLFFQRQTNNIHQDYQVAGLASDVSVNGMTGTLWLTQQYRVDKDYAMFGEASWDIAPTLTLTGGVRAYIYDNSLVGFFGFGRAAGNGYTDSPYNAAGSSHTGVSSASPTRASASPTRSTAGNPNPTLLPSVLPGAPCTNLAIYANGAGLQPVDANGDGQTYRVNLSWKPNRDTLLYATVSRGFRPGGINRRVDVAPYAADFLTNFELGWKLTLMGGLLHFNGAVYQENWKNFQFAFLGQNSFTEIHNGPNARIRGVEVDTALNAGPLNLSLAGTYTDAITRQNLCLFPDPSFTCMLPSVDGITNLVSSPKGTRLPITPKWKLTGTARYTVPMGAAKVYGQVNADLSELGVERHPRGDLPGLHRGHHRSRGTDRAAAPVRDGRTSRWAANWDKFRIEGYVSNLFDARGQLSRFVECGQCFQRVYIVPITPRTFGLRAGVDF